MWNIPTETRLSKIPRLYETEDVPLQDKLIYLHFYIGGCDWYIAEFDGEDTFFGLVKGFETELGNFSLSELTKAKGPMGLSIERDRHFRPMTVGEAREA